jgi:WD40 repeat protein/predicted Ser/Thr protein kinase
MDLFDEACDLGPDERRAVVDRARAEDAELGARLDGLLAADAGAAGGAVGESTRPEKPAARSKPPPAASPLAIGGFRIVRLLGEGGMGVVYEAEQEQPSRRVALKVLHAAAPDRSRRFELEIATLARLAHPGIAAIHAAGTDGGWLYYAMELVDGERLDRHAATLGLRERLALLARVCDAVHHAHQKGIVHRDLKPANILVRGDQPKVLDFGIARLLDADPESRATLAGQIVGTPYYMSPEQAAHEDVDARSDVYALGVIAYELVAGRLPYVPARTLSGVLRAVREHEIVPLTVGGDLQVVVERALAADPEARYASAAALADDLRRLLADEPIAARPPTLREQLARFARKNRALTATAIALVVVLVAGAATATAAFVAANRARRELAARNRALVLERARAELGSDPTQAATTLGAAAREPGEARGVARLAVDRGVALAILVGHATEVRSVVFAPDGATLATAGYDHTVRLWELARAAGRILDAPGERVAFVRYSPRGVLVSGGPDGLRAWQPDRRLDGAAVADAAWSPDGGTLAVVRAGREVMLRGAGGEPGPTLELPNVARVAWAPGGVALAVAGTDGKVWLVAPPGGAARLLGAHRDEVSDLTFAGADAVVSGSRDGEVRRWRLAGPPGGELLETVRRLKAVTCARDVCAWADHDGRISLWQPGELRHLRAHEGAVYSIAFAPDGQGFASAGDDAVVRLWEVASAAHIDLRGHHARVRMVVFSADGARLASAADDGTVRVWAASSPARRLAHDGPVTALAVSGDAPRVASAGADGSVRLFALEPGQPAFAGGAPAPIWRSDDTEGVTTLALGATRVVAAGRDRDVHIWELAGGAERTRTAPARVVRVAVAGDLVAAATLGRDVPVWDLAAGTSRLLVGHGDRVNEVRFLDDGRLLTAGDDRTVRAWDPATGAGSVLATCDDQVNVLAVARDGTIAAGSIDGTVRLLPSGRELRAHEGRVLALAFAADGRLASGGHDRSVRVWDPARGTGAVVLELDAPVTALAWAGATLVATGDDGVAAAWSQTAGAAVVGLGQRVIAAPDGSFVVTGGDDGALRRLSLTPGEDELPPATERLTLR